MSGAPRKTGTKAFTSIGGPLGESFNPYKISRINILGTFLGIYLLYGSEAEGRG